MASAVHTGSQIVAGEWTFIRFPHDAEDNDYAPGHVFPEEIAGLATDYDDRNLVHILLHMDAHPVSHVAAHINAAAAHAVAEHVPGHAVNDNLAFIHGVGDAVLGVAVYG